MQSLKTALILVLLTFGAAELRLNAAVEPITRLQPALNADQMAGATKIAQAITRDDSAAIEELFTHYFEKGIIAYKDPVAAFELTKDLDSAVRHELGPLSPENNEAGLKFIDLIKLYKEILQADQCVRWTNLGQFAPLNKELLAHIGQFLRFKDLVRFGRSARAAHSTLEPVRRDWDPVNCWTKEQIHTILLQSNVYQYVVAVSAITFSPDGALLAVGSSTGSLDIGIIKLIDVATGKEIWKFLQNSPHNFGGAGHVCALAFSRDGSLLASSSPDGLFRLWDVHRGELIRDKKFDGVVEAMRFSADNTHVMALLKDKSRKVMLLEINPVTLQSRCVSQIEYGYPLYHPTLSADNTMFAQVAPPNSHPASLFDFVARSQITLGNDRQTCYIFSHDSSKVVSNGNNMITVWDMKTKSVLQRFVIEAESRELIDLLAFSPDDKIVAFRDGTIIKLLNINNGAIIRAFTTPESYGVLNTAASFSPDGTTFAMGDVRGNVSIWSVW